MVIDGLEPYSLSSFGYTPLSIVFSGYIGRFLDGIASVRNVMAALGMINYIILTYFVYHLNLLIHKDGKVACYTTLLFAGVSQIGLISTAILDPKIFVCSLLSSGLYFHLKKRTTISFLLVSLSVWVWQPSVILLCGFVMIGLMREGMLKTFYPAFKGVIFASIVPVAYLMMTKQMLDFTYTALISRFDWAVSERSYIPFKFLSIPFGEEYIWDLYFFLFAIIGFILAVVFSWKTLKRSDWRLDPISDPLIITIFFIVLLNMEAGARDILTFIGVLSIWVGYALQKLFITKKHHFVMCVVVVIAFVDFLFIKEDVNGKSMKILASDLRNTYPLENGNYLTAGRISEGLNVEWELYSYEYHLRLNEANTNTKYNCNGFNMEIGTSICYVFVDNLRLQSNRSSYCQELWAAIEQKECTMTRYRDVTVFEF